MYYLTFKARRKDAKRHIRLRSCRPLAELIAFYNFHYGDDNRYIWEIYTGDWIRVGDGEAKDIDLEKMQQLLEEGSY